MEKRRIEWVDLYKALVIICVVIGHTTGLFNDLIYQFHMAAFFFISGYTASLEKKAFFDVMWNKCCTILLPWATVFVGMALGIWALNKLGWYSMLFTGTYPGFRHMVTEFFLRGSVYIEWLGATWFLPVLFLVYGIQKVLLMVNRNRLGLRYFLISLLLFLFGYHCAAEGWHCRLFIFTFDLAWIAQFYFAVGLLARRSELLEELRNKKAAPVLVFATAATVMLYFKLVGGNTVDFPVRAFGNWAQNAIGAFAGILVVFCIAVLLEKLPKLPKKLLITVGKNTLGVLFLHFMMFKVAFFMLYLGGIVEIDYLRLFLGEGEIKNRIWWFVTTVSVACSVGLWYILCRIPFINVLLGQTGAVYENWKTRLLHWRPVRELTDTVKAAHIHLTKRGSK